MLPGNSYTFAYTYNASTGMLETYEYPSGYKLKYLYDSRGNQHEVRTADAANTLLWKANAENQRGQLTQATMGNGTITDFEWDTYGFPQRNKVSKGSTILQNLTFSFNSVTGNLNARSDAKRNILETFDYDNLLKDRLISWSASGGAAKTMTYEANGNILKKTDVSTSNTGYVYDTDKPNFVKKVINPTAAFLEQNQLQNITYTPFNKIESISQPGFGYNVKLDFTYGPDNERRKTFLYKASSPVTPYETRYYFDDFEVRQLNQKALLKKIHYLYGPDGMFGIYMLDGGYQYYYYIHKDYLGSITAISDAAGNLIESRRSGSLGVWESGGLGVRRLRFCLASMDVGSGFDERSITKTDLVQFAAGTQNTEDNCRNPNNRNDYNVTSTLFDRGFTGHACPEQSRREHLPQFGLINMNGRVYDPFLARFLSPDPYVQAPDNNQNFNRYSYCVNNPLKYTDPSGNFFLIDSYLIGFIHGFFSTGSDRWGAGMSEAIKRSGNDVKIWGGLFVTDPNKSTGGQLWEVISRFTWQLPQTIGGWGTAQSYNTFGLKGGVESVEYKYGATVVSTRKDWTAVTQGSYIVGGNRLKADANNPLFQHEYGHYIQSQDMGWAYYSRVGLPSLGSEKGNYKQNYPSHNYHPVEQDANRRAFLYFNKHVDGFQDDEFKYDDKGWNFMANPLDINKTGQGEYIDYQNANSVSLLNNLKVKPKWYDYIFPIISGFYNSYQYNH